MTRGRSHGKFAGRSYPAICVSKPTVPKPTTVSPQQNGTLTNIETLTQTIIPTICETPPATPNQSNLVGQGLSTQRNVPTGHTNIVAEDESNTSNRMNLDFLTSAG
ncbi:hypothetical protein EJD97_002195 [Solanum chilense]|uniref:Uncharacterized protein n=1 Tax=Solanum chilense TaxID=4083 RepID=A0A6N2C4Q3_SOLCI|nr:hypothetical protein EJD97_002195 [Solanum chilense]